jgi:hemerythrin-like domain-containing protein
MLVRVIEETGGGPLPDGHRRALETALDYFATAAPRHTQDEEHSLFPRMRASGEPAAAAAIKRIEALEADHAAASRAHRRVDELGRSWLSRGRLPRDEAEEMRRTLRELEAAYARHIRVEDEDVFPLAERVLAADELAAIGREMEARRG